MRLLIEYKYGCINKITFLVYANVQKYGYALIPIGGVMEKAECERAKKYVYALIGIIYKV